jgi:glycosyltransferase involved in cell wall biosynthesis
MRVALVVHGWPGDRAGGTGLYVEALSTALARAGHPVAVVSPRSATGPGDDAPGVTRWPLADPAPRSFRGSWARPAMLEAWRRFQRAWRPDVVHVHHLSGLPMGLPAAARAGGARVVLTLHDYALVCPRGQLVDAALRPCPGPAPGRCATCLGPHLQLNPITARIGRALDRLPRVRARAKAGLGAALVPGRRAQDRVTRRLDGARQALEAAHQLLSPSLDLATRMVDQGWPRPAHTALPLVRPVGVAPAPGSGPVRFLFASSVIPTKGPDRLLEAFAGLPTGRALLTIAGGAPSFDGHPGFGDAIRTRAEALRGATWRGAVPPADVPALMAAHDVLVLPSTWPENSPLVIREASAAGLRIVASARGGAAELDPHLRPVDPDGGVDALRAALRAEVDEGRGRRAPLDWPSAADHAAALLTGPYSAG